MKKKGLTPIQLNELSQTIKDIVINDKQINSDTRKAKISETLTGIKRKKGAKRSKATREAISLGMKNRIITEEHKAKLREANLGGNFISCPHCFKQSRIRGLMIRWHFDNCKHKPQVR